MARVNTYKAMIIAIICLFLCIVMLCGTTFAWYRASVDSATNVIKTGGFDLSFLWSDHAGGTWNTLTDSSKLFNTNQFEPGVGQVRYVKIVNSSAMTVQISIGLEDVSTGGAEEDMNFYTLFGVGSTDVTVGSMTASGTAASPTAAVYTLAPDSTVVAAVAMELSSSSLHPASEVRWKLALNAEQTTA